MTELERIKEALNSGTVPAGANTKQFEKLLKKCSHIVGAKVVNLYTIRDCGFEDSTYRVFAFPVKSDTIDDSTLNAIKEEINALPIGDIRFNSVAAGAFNIDIDTESGNYPIEDAKEDSVKEICNHFDGIVIYTAVVDDRKNLEKLDAHYMVYGKWDGSGLLKYDGGTIYPIDNATLGNVSNLSGIDSIERSTTEESMPKAAQTYAQIMQYVMYALIAIGIVWYFFFR